MILRIKDWTHKYENSRTRLYDELDWVPVPNRLDGDGYTLLVNHKHGAAHLAAWYVILAVGSRRPKAIRGTLMRDCGKPHDADSLSRISRIPASVFREAIPRLVSPEIGWLEEVQETATDPPATDQQADSSLSVRCQRPDSAPSVDCGLARAQNERTNGMNGKNETTTCVGEPKPDRIRVKMPPPLSSHPIMESVRGEIHRAMTEGFEVHLEPPDNRLCLNVIEAMGERDVGELGPALLHVCRTRRGQKPRNYGFLLTALRDLWGATAEVSA